MVERKQIEILYWDKKYTIEEIANKLNVSFSTLYNIMRKYDIHRRNRSEAGYNYYKIKPQFEIRHNLSIADEKLKIAGIMLYWAEGTLKGHTVDFANSNPEAVEVFLRFLRQICGVSEDRLRVYLYTYSYQDLQAIRKYWHRITDIPLCQFTKPYIREGNPNLSNRKLPYGLVHIRYNDKKLLELIKSWIVEYTNNVLIKGRYPSGQRGQTVRSSVLPKGRMEK